MRHALDGQVNSAAATAAADSCATGPEDGPETTKYPLAEEDEVALPRRSSAPCTRLLELATAIPVGGEKASEKVERLAMTNAASAATAGGVRRFHLWFCCQDVAIPAQATSLLSNGRKIMCASGTPIALMEPSGTALSELGGARSQHAFGLENVNPGPERIISI